MIIKKQLGGRRLKLVRNRFHGLKLPFREKGREDRRYRTWAYDFIAYQSLPSCDRRDKQYHRWALNYLIARLNFRDFGKKQG